MVAEIMPVSRSELLELGLPCSVTLECIEDVMSDNDVVDVDAAHGLHLHHKLTN